ncbi:MAG: formylglycine-generating enzyme family protein, partial [Candidatus Electryoneaceae bacterium]|nr:formylglycine-generating enzyme family protein [Candidatus Electryoneaceae bacterium]
FVFILSLPPDSIIGMRSEFEDAKEYEKQESKTPNEKITYWRNFLSKFTYDYNSTPEDNKMRFYANERIKHLNIQEPRDTQEPSQFLEKINSVLFSKILWILVVSIVSIIITLHWWEYARWILLLVVFIGILVYTIRWWESNEFPTVEDKCPPLTGTEGTSIERVKGFLTGMDFVHIPDGSFQMGSNEGDPDEKPVHSVTISPFYMMTTEVTQGMWQEVMDSNPSHFEGDNFPVEQVSWVDAQEFIETLNRLDTCLVYRLPSEAEWEYSCRAGTTTKYYSGNNSLDLDGVGWCNSTSDGKTHPVRQKSANDWGLYDMHGNVWEWCEDCYYDNYDYVTTDGTAWISQSGTNRVIRGGCWGNNYNYCRSANRGKRDPAIPEDRQGFRLAMSK